MKIMKKRLAILLVFSGLFLCFVAGQVLAQSEGLVPCGEPGNPCKLCHFFVMFDRIVDFVLIDIVPPIAALMLVIGGVMFFTAAGDPGKLTKAKSLLTSVVFGLIIVYGAWLIINTFFLTIGVNEWTGLGEGWFTYPCQ